MRINATTRGFTLLELMVTIAIIGILTAIMIPQYGSYRRRAADARAQSDLANGATAEEAYFVQASRYERTNCTGIDAHAEYDPILPGAKCSPGDTVIMDTDGDGSHLLGFARAEEGSRNWFAYDSASGRSLGQLD